MARLPLAPASVLVWSRGLVALALAAGLCSSTAFAAGIVSVGTAPGTSGSGANAISGTGGVVAVTSDFVSNTPRASRWTSGAGLVSLTPLMTTTGAYLDDINQDGTVIVGTSTFANDTVRATRWVDGVPQDVGILSNGTSSLGQGVSGDGQVVTGVVDDPDTIYAFRWTSGGGLVNLGLLPGGSYSQGRKLNQDGSVLIGVADDDQLRNLAVRWTQAAASSGLQPLPLLSANDPNSGAFGMTPSGTTIVGFSGDNAVKWVDGIVQNLGRLAGADNAIAYAASADGSVIGGYNFFGSSARATLWLPGVGQVQLSTYLQGLGVDLTGWNLQYVRDISADGLTIVGEGTFNGADRGWVVTIPSPGPAGGAMLIAGVLAVRRRRR